MAQLERFENRLEAGTLLAQRLHSYARRTDAIVLALPRGGVPVGFAVARDLEVPLDILLVRKLGVPGHEEHAMGAIASGGFYVLQPDVIDTLDIPRSVIEAIAQRELAEIERRETLYRDGHPALQLHDRIVILVDDGLATGSTMLAAMHVVRQLSPARLIIAVPVASAQTCRDLGSEVDEMICLRTPEPFYAVSLWYKDFEQVSDHEVIRLLEEARQAYQRRIQASPASAAGTKTPQDARSRS